MQDLYAGDIGDYGKYGLLRHLFCTQGDWKLGVVWFLCPPTKGKNDGKYIKYLANRSFAGCDPDLYKSLASVVYGGRRSVDAVERSQCLGCRTAFFRDVLDFAGMPVHTEQDRHARKQHRAEWLARALKATAGCDAVFLDPDNGLECASIARHGKTGPKFVFFDEIEKFASRGQIVVVYHHLNRHRDHGPHERQMNERMSQLRERVSEKVFGLRYTPYSPRAFFIISTSEHQRQIKHRLDSLMTTTWRNHFELFV